MSFFVRGGAIVLAGMLALAGCSAHDKGSTPHPTLDETWNDGKQITQPVTIPFGSTVTIAKGARITVAKGASITVQGTLKAQSRDAHAKLSGDGWPGIVVVTGGAVDLDGVDIASAQTALDVQGGTASYQYGVISASGPFNVAKSAKLGVAHSQVAGSLSSSLIYGDFVATYLDYDANAGEGIVGQGDGATISIEDSKLHAVGNGDNDLVVSKALSKIHVAYTELSKAHCNFHFDSIDAFDISFVSAHDGGYGLMLYGSSGDGPRTVKSSNIFKNFGHGAEEETQNTRNGVITISDGYWADNGAGPDDNLRQFTGQVKVVNMSTTTPVQGVGPRGAVP